MNKDNFDINHGVAPRGKGTEVGTILQLETCPYNESHRIGHGSFAAHLYKCRMALKSEDRERYVICEYNATHHMFAEVYEDHLKTCTDFRYYEADKFEMPLEFYGHATGKKVAAKESVSERDEILKQRYLEDEMKRRRDDDDRKTGRVVDEHNKRHKDLEERMQTSARHAVEEDEYMLSF